MIRLGINASLQLRHANRHGLVTGATGTGKTVTLLTLAEGFSRAGVPVFFTDIKGDVGGLAMPGSITPPLQARALSCGIADYATEGSPVDFWDVFAVHGHPIRATVQGIGPTLMARMLELNDTQAGTLDILYKLAGDRGLPLTTLADLGDVLRTLQHRRQQISHSYGLISGSSIGAIQRAILRLDMDGGAEFFGAPALNLSDLMRHTADGRGIINLLSAAALVRKPRLYSTFLLWLLSQLSETLPEVGNLDKPKLVLILDEAHLLFYETSPALRQQVEQIVRLIRSKGVGVYFCSQLPDDMPANILAQLGNRIQHALHAFTPRDQRAVRAAADTFMPNPLVDTAAMIGKLETGQALVSTLQGKGVPMPVELVTMAPPRCRMGAILDSERAAIIAASPMGAKYQPAITSARKAPTTAAAPDDDGAIYGDLGQTIRALVFADD